MFHLVRAGGDVAEWMRSCKLKDLQMESEMFRCFVKSSLYDTGWY